MKIIFNKMATKVDKAFTLIELLVVIAIISLLISILLPSLNRARDLAKGIVCKTNLKTLGMSSLLYAQENNQCFPDVKVYDTANPTNNFTFRWDAVTVKDRLESYLGDTRAMYCPFNEYLSLETTPDFWAYQALFAGQDVDDKYCMDTAIFPLIWDASYAGWGYPVWPPYDCNHLSDEGRIPLGNNGWFVDGHVAWRYRDEAVDEGTWFGD